MEKIAKKCGQVNTIYLQKTLSLDIQLVCPGFLGNNPTGYYESYSFMKRSAWYTKLRFPIKKGVL